ncbi:hypothetical protein Ga0074812_113125 [Parafrankia irregularis]|uniref:Uncharacterized protein n=1 Tax=Parafrankia irregularis TaxID=795642 RepID=A0A0S4QPL0_9ACTN|nr:MULTISPECIES: hypothetical protein [Parafrankia]MBE3206158.1 hypothetical protein [Parafrankia sp. CH37]CUU57627.1 hypothetical protein Ga0074812_113125 [Parafrankia irregularis]
MAGRDVWVDFNDLDVDMRITAYADAVEAGVELTVGARVLVGDDEGNTASATVVVHEVNSPAPDEFTFQVDMSTFSGNAAGRTERDSGRE